MNLNKGIASKSEHDQWATFNVIIERGSIWTLTSNNILCLLGQLSSHQCWLTWGLSKWCSRSHGKDGQLFLYMHNTLHWDSNYGSTLTKANCQKAVLFHHFFFIMLAFSTGTNIIISNLLLNNVNNMNVLVLLSFRFNVLDCFHIDAVRTLEVWLWSQFLQLGHKQLLVQIILECDASIIILLLLIESEPTQFFVFPIQHQTDSNRRLVCCVLLHSKTWQQRQKRANRNIEKDN